MTGAGYGSDESMRLSSTQSWPELDGPRDDVAAGSSIYEEIGVRPVINAAGTLTRLGGSIMPREVVLAMARAAERCVRIDELQARASGLIVEATGAEAGYVTCGAAASLLLGTAACVAGLDIAHMERLPDTIGMKNEIVVQRPHRNSYDHAVRAAGVKLVEVGGLGHPTPRPVEAWEIDAAISERTAAVLWPVMPEARVASLPEVVAVAHRHGVPVLVDAAAALPPKANLRAFIADGADLVAFSGGKALRGPQASGILAGRRELIESVALQHQDMDVSPATWSLRASLLETGRLPGPPGQGIGRSLKVGKEEIVGLLTALRLFLERDEVEDMASWQRQAQEIVAGVADLPQVDADVDEQEGTGIPLARVRWNEAGLGLPGRELVEALAEGTPPICVRGDGAGGLVYLNPFSLAEGEATVVAARLREVLTPGSSHRDGRD